MESERARDNNVASANRSRRAAGTNLQNARVNGCRSRIVARASKREDAISILCKASAATDIISKAHIVAAVVGYQRSIVDNCARTERSRGTNPVPKLHRARTDGRATGVRICARYGHLCGSGVCQGAGTRIWRSLKDVIIDGVSERHVARAHRYALRRNDERTRGVIERDIISRIKSVRTSTVIPVGGYARIPEGRIRSIVTLPLERCCGTDVKQQFRGGQGKRAASVDLESTERSRDAADCIEHNNSRSH